MTAPGGAAVAARTADRSKHLIAAAAVLLALWMGLAAPSVSPVSGPAATSSVVQDQGRAVGGVAAVDDPDGDGGPRGRDGGRGR